MDIIEAVRVDLEVAQGVGVVQQAPTADTLVRVRDLPGAVAGGQDADPIGAVAVVAYSR